MVDTGERCSHCRDDEVNRLRNELSQCKKRGQSKDKRIKALDKRVFILTAIAVGVCAIFGKEALDALTEWMQSIKAFRGAAGVSLVLPAPSTAAVFALGLIGPSRRRKR